MLQTTLSNLTLSNIILFTKKLFLYKMIFLLKQQWFVILAVFLYRKTKKENKKK